MGLLLDPELLEWLESGGRVVTASERTARALATAFNRLRLESGQSAWKTPQIEPWQQFVLRSWQALAAGSPRMILAPLAEQSLWAAAAGSEAELATTLEPSRQRLGRLAMEAHALLANYAPDAFNPRTRIGWQRDHAAFSRWLSIFESECRSAQLLSSARLPLELLPLLEESTTPRPPLLLVGFDRIQPIQRQLFDAWGVWRELPLAAPRAAVHFYAAPDQKTEYAACARWCQSQLDQNPEARLIVLAQNQALCRGQLERAFQEQLPDSGAASHFEFSLGVALGKTTLVRAARLLLGWLSHPLEEHEIDALFSSGHTAASSDENSALERRMRHLRQRGRQRAAWSVDAFLNERSDVPVPPDWQQRLIAARALLGTHASSTQSPLAWAELVPRILDAAGWPGGRPLSSAEFQIQRRLEESLDTCATLGAVTHRTGWNSFLAILDRALDETLYAPESESAPILIAGPAETAGLSADGIWFLGATEDAWPATGITHPFLPLGLQREAEMPHAHPSIDWALAEKMTLRLAASTCELVFSHPRQVDGTEAHPSRLALQFAGQPEALPDELLPTPHPKPLAVPCEDRSQIPYPPGSAPGGSELLTNQSACPFRAFASARLGARDWEAAEAGLTAAQRGTLLHAVLHSVWSGPPEGLRSLNELLALRDRADFVRRHVERVFDKTLPSGAHERMPRRYLALEQKRLASLVSEWLAYEATRVDFAVKSTELESPVSIEGLALRLRMDRIDELNDGTLLIVDYKSGDLSPKAWELPRPEDPQLPLYAAFGQEDGEIGGLVFAKVRRGEMEFAGRVGEAAKTLLPSLKGTSALVKHPFSAEILLDWRDEIEKLAQAFVAGDAAVNPREFPKTCERCALPGLCRIRDFPPTSEDEETLDEAAHD